jgi:non-specific serine/threonine protein kinase/serine/threonine-protein kinase
MMDSSADRSRWQRVEELFHRALELEGSREKRAAAVRSWTGADAELSDEVLSLIESSEAVEEARSADPPRPSADAWLGRVVGGYRMVGELGRGGMGVVYAAERVAGAEGQVALKVVATRLRSEWLIERFHEERRALAAVRHPHIAHLLDGGVSPTGEPYFVMELIEGERLDSYCQSLAQDAILTLFAQLCEAVSFAHNHRILHGDLKPSNVMVTAEGELKLLDFGAAMLLPMEGADREEATPLAAFTPEYASPERMVGGVCAAASDVYSLGAMLYRLLTGRVPVRGVTRIPVSANQETTTTVLADAAAKPPTADRAEPSRLVADATLDVDLRAIIARAMAADPDERYASAMELAADLRRFKEHRPVEARPASPAELVAKFARRNRKSLAVLLLLGCALSGGAAVAVRQTHAARAEEQRARRQMTAVRQLASFLSTDFYDRLIEVPGSIETQRRVTAQALQYLDGMSKDAGGDFDFEVDLATAYVRVGGVQGDPYQPNLGDAKGAMRTVKRGREIAEQALQLRPRDLRALRAAMLAEQTVSEILFGAGDAAAAVPYSKRATELGEKLVASKEATVKDFIDVAGIYSVLGDQYDLQGAASLGDQPAAIAAYRKFIALDQQALQRDTANVRAMRGIGIGYQKIGNLLVEQNPSEARPLFVAALQQFNSIPHPSPLIERQKGILHQKLSDCFYFEDNYRAALAELKIAESIYMPLAAQDPSNMRVQQSMASIYRDEGENYEALLEWREAQVVYQRLAAILIAALRKDPSNRIWQSHYAETLISIANAERNLGAKSEAEEFERQGLALSVRLAQDGDVSADDLDNAARHLLGAEPASLRLPKQALTYALHANQLVHDSEPDYQMTLAKAQQANGDPRAARATAEKLLGMHPSKDVRREAETLLHALDASKR